MAGTLLLFDGVCNLCHGAVRFVIARDPGGRFRFAPLQSDAGRAALRRFGLPEHDLAGVVLVEGERVWTGSAAALATLRRLRAPWPAVARLVALLPAPLRDALYRFVARHRYRWFGRKASCPAPPPEWRERFLG
jgi:predicted DCC family thiol-disulfide oxidoreductase YuxK